MVATGKLFLLCAAVMFLHTGYQTMVTKTMYQQKDVMMSSSTGGDSSFQGRPDGGIIIAWQLIVATIMAGIGGLLTRGPLKPIHVSDAPPLTGEYPEFRDFLSCSTRGTILGALLAEKKEP